MTDLYRESLRNERRRAMRRASAARLIAPRSPFETREPEHVAMDEESVARRVAAIAEALGR